MSIFEPDPDSDLDSDLKKQTSRFGFKGERVDLDSDSRCPDSHISST